MTREEATKIAYDMGAHPYSIDAMTDALMKGYEIGKQENLENQRKMLVDKACMWLCKTCEIGICPEERRCHRYKGFYKAMEKKI